MYKRQDNQDYSQYSKAYFASGCFWCVETIYESLEGVKEVYSGYAGGSTVNPNYYQVMTGRTGHAESIEIIYDESVIKFEMLLKVFFDSHDPTTMNRQGPDYGTQYRSIAFYSDEREKEKINNYINLLSSNANPPMLPVLAVISPFICNCSPVHSNELLPVPDKKNCPLDDLSLIHI